MRRLTDQSSGVPFVSDRDASWSPDHTHIVFMSSDAVAPTHLPVLSAAGAPVADLPVQGMTPVWLDTATVLCVVGRAEPDGTGRLQDLVAVDVPGGTARPLTAVAPGELLGEPAWHPTGGLAATLTREDPATGEWVSSQLVLAPAATVSATLTGGAPLTAASFADVAPGCTWPAGPDWSPDGARIAFSASRPCATTQPDGTPVLQMDVAIVTPPAPAGGPPGPLEWVTDDTAGSYHDGLNDGSPAFSPDGAWLAWARGHEDDWTRIVVKQLGTTAAPTVLMGDEHWFRWGLDW
ncbi:PD40 domain-containing protein [Humibacillus xanthopallidus]|uniref:WD40 repeat protein n=1 Tax=Humibacillus xanthopallidus TaxID=412689 RepID=A0A543HVY2_9MICO|nr:PD40 domain-containing protein [Humibacillus xanthopallidus]TQM62497.1 WD40 repeat protein [Humibacillus xanthopallidus]